MKPTAVLIVEDEFIMARDLALRLRDLGYAVAGTAATGADAVALADRQHPDLVLMDIHLQGSLDGIDAAREIRRRQRLPVVFLTAYADDETLHRAKLAEPFGYILKPCEDRELRTLIEIALYKHRAEEEIRRLAGLYATLSQINQAIVRIAERQELLDAICRITARHAGFQLAWIGWLDPQTQQVRPISRAGTAGGYLDEIVVRAGGRPEEDDPVGVCLREGRPCVLNDLQDDARAAPWRAAAGRYALRAAAAMPVHYQGAVCAAFVVYAATPGVFQAQEITLLEEAAADISFALDHLETERQRREAEERLAHLAYHDGLTELPNRVLLTDRLRQAMAQSRRERKKLAVGYLDLDNFKALDDAWGHAQGDRILVEVARRLTHCVRAGDTVARLGGDEFVLLLGNLADVEECERALERVRAALHAPFQLAGQTVVLTASLGVTLYPDDDAEPDVLLRHTDQAMYAAKQAGGRCYHWFDADHDSRARAHRELLDRVAAGLAAGEFRLHYQPKVDMRGGAVIGVEALIRWQDPERGLLAPGCFMPAVETSDLAIAVDRWVLEEALRQMSVWAGRGLTLPVSVNVSGRHLQRPDFVAGLQAALAAHPAVPPEWLELEILETAALDDVAAISRRIDAGQRLGVRFSLDDFGTGYSSLTYLKHLPVQVLKIDQSFVRDLLVDPDARAIVEGVIGLSAAFRRQVIAEGVETAAHGRRLLELGCDFAQGYGIARPMPSEQIPDWIAGWTASGAWVEQCE